MAHTLVIRFGALGDLCLLAWSLAAHAHNDAKAGAGDGLFLLATKPVYADLLRQARGIDEVVALPGPRLVDLWRLARQLRRRPLAAVIDAHDSLRSHMLLAMLGRRARSRLAKDTAARLALLFWRRRHPDLHRTMHDRFDDLFTGPGRRERAGAGRGSEIVVTPPLAGAAPRDPTEPPRLGVAPGARWKTKRWPAERFADLLRGFRACSGARVRLFLGPQEKVWFEGSALGRAAAEIEGVSVWRDRSLVEIARGLAGCAALVTNDSGLLHLAEAVGTPVLALFGPTVREFGYFPSLAASRVLQTEISCRPCSRNGKRPCYRGDLACLTEISAPSVLEELRRMPAWHDLAAGRPDHV